MKRLSIAFIVIILTVLFSVPAVSAAGKESASTAVNVPTPMISDCAPVNGGHKVSWSASAGAAKYRLYRKVDGGWSRIAETASTSYTHTGLQNNTTVTYTVRAFDAYGTAVSSYNRTGVTATYHSIPQLKAAACAYGGQNVSWTAVPGAVNYKVYIKTGSSWRSVGTTTGSSFLYRGAVSGVSYTYTVRCFTADGKQAQSYFDKNGVTAVYYAAPEITGFTPTDGGTLITWSAVDGADRYRLFYKTDSGWKGIATTTSTALTHAGLVDRRTYVYTVRALNSAGAYISSYRPDGWQHTYYAAPGITGVTYDGDYTVSWNPPADVTGWQLYRKTPGSPWKLVLNTRKRTSYTDEDVQPDIPYSYMLCCVNRAEDALSAAPEDTLYYLGGALADGELEFGGNLLTFNDGRLRHGYVTVGGRLYYYISDGVPVKSGIVGSDSEGYTVADENGVCCVSEEIRLAAKFMMTYATGDTLDERMKTGYLYLSHHFPYNRTYDHPSKAAEMPALAIDMFTNERGNCYRYAACFACIAKIAGYRARVVLGSTTGNPHGWVEVLVDGKWLICDPDAEIPKYNKPDYTAYMMKEHYWQIVSNTRCEITIDENGVAVWK